RQLVLPGRVSIACHGLEGVQDGVVFVLAGSLPDRVLSERRIEILKAQLVGDRQSVLVRPHEFVACAVGSCENELGLVVDQLSQLLEMERLKLLLVRGLVLSYEVQALDEPDYESFPTLVEELSKVKTRDIGRIREEPVELLLGLSQRKVASDRT